MTVTPYTLYKDATLVCALLIAFTSFSYAESTPDTPTYWQVKSGEMMWNIAGKARADKSITRFQAMMALLRSNPQAFHYSCNINSLKVGERLLIPSKAVMQSFAAREAAQEYSRQLKAWEDFRGNGTPINCPEPVPLSTAQPASGDATPESVANSVDRLAARDTETATASPPAASSPYFNIKPLNHTPPATLAPAEPPPASGVDRAVDAPPASVTHEASLSSAPFASNSENTVTMQASPPETAAITANNHASLPLILIIASLVGLSVMLLGGIVLGWLLHRWLSTRPASSGTSTTAVKTPPTFTQNPKTPIAEPVTSAEAQIEEKLRHVRTYLAEGESVVQVLLRDIIQQGSTQQQEEARQLYEINKKLASLEDYPSNPPVTDHAAWEDLRTASQAISLKNYVSEDETRLFVLIDKIFELLDSELHAEGRLLQAYRQRQSEAVLETDAYEVVDKPEEAEVSPRRRARAVRKPTRRL